MRRRFTLPLLLIIVIAGAVLVTAVYLLAIRKATTAAVPIRIAHIGVTSDLPVFVAADKGFFAKHGLQAEFVRVGSSTQVIEAVIAGRAEVGSGIAVATALAAWQTSPGLFRVIGLVEFTGEGRDDCILVKKDSPITQFADLAGKKIGSLPGSTWMPLVVQIVAERHGLPAKSVQYVGIAPSLQVEALLAGTVDAIYATAAQCDQALEMGVARIILENPQTLVMNPAPSLVAVISTSFEKTQPRGARAVEEALNEALAYVKTHPSDSEALLAKRLEAPIKLIHVAAARSYRRSADINEQNLQTFADLLLQRGLLTKRVDVAAMLRKP